MKQCIWCGKTEKEQQFDTKAHTIPKGLGGVTICDNVCDKCNHYFGTHQNGYPSVELIIKETFNLSRARLFDVDRGNRKNNIPRFTSEYFKLDVEKAQIDIKDKYKLRKGFQQEICRLLKRGLYKIFLEENERLNRNSSESKFDFIREFARNNRGDLPVYYFHRGVAMIASGEKLLRQPHVMFNEAIFPYIYRGDNFYEFEFFGHVLSVTTSRSWHLSVEKYLSESTKIKAKYFKSYKKVTHWNDIDIPLAIFDES